MILQISRETFINNLKDFQQFLRNKHLKFISEEILKIDHIRISLEQFLIPNCIIKYFRYILILSRIV